MSRQAAIKIEGCNEKEKAELDDKMFDEFDGAMIKPIISTDAVARGIRRYGKKYNNVSLTFVEFDGNIIVMEYKE